MRTALAAEVRLPDAAWALHEDRDVPVAAHGRDGRYTTDRVEIATRPADDGLKIEIAAPGAPLSRVALRWRRHLTDSTLILGDAWERAYGDLQWRHHQPERVLPWYWLGHDPGRRTTVSMGVRVRPNAFCSWLVDHAGTTLWLDVRNGGMPVLLGDRMLHAATVVEVHGAATEPPWQVQRRLCRALCDDPLLPNMPLVGCNNWYHTYGENFDASDVLRDAETIVELTNGHPIRPFCTVDAGWSPGGVTPGGPWDTGVPGRFDDVPALAQEIRRRGARPAIWLRPVATRDVTRPGLLRIGAEAASLDITVDENLETIHADIQRMTDWGFELIKHDFSTYDSLGRFGPTMGAEITDPGWRFANRTVTSAEAILRLYRVIREAAGPAVILGCNTVGHLAAGLVHAQRVGDDNSGRRWERTRRMGVNALAFRAAQHRSFYAVDADCVPCTSATPWRQNRQFLDLVAHSGTALFVSIEARARTPEATADLRNALGTALDNTGDAEPLDWLTTTAPRHWRLGNIEKTYEWDERIGAWPLLD